MPEALTHCYPSKDRPSLLAITTPGFNVSAPLEECWLCQRDLCLQNQRDRVVIHSIDPEKDVGVLVCEPCEDLGPLSGHGWREEFRREHEYCAREVRS